MTKIHKKLTTLILLGAFLTSNSHLIFANSSVLGPEINEDDLTFLRIVEKSGVPITHIAVGEARDNSSSFDIKNSTSPWGGLYMMGSGAKLLKQMLSYSSEEVGRVAGQASHDLKHGGDTEGLTGVIVLGFGLAILALPMIPGAAKLGAELAYSSVSYPSNKLRDIFYGKSVKFDTFLTAAKFKHSKLNTTYLTCYYPFTQSEQASYHKPEGTILESWGLTELNGHHRINGRWGHDAKNQTYFGTHSDYLSLVEGCLNGLRYQYPWLKQIDATRIKLFAGNSKLSRHPIIIYQEITENIRKLIEATPHTRQELEKMEKSKYILKSEYLNRLSLYVQEKSAQNK